ncbi:hypothetical protein BpHYR1_040228 [Brachionus plicatilis]|uniref:Uncharacterized protein n=1 Tax=Brachionus plicatilis TaxID=10195 RepID=A0A3M7S1B8_BRAPC|nr:hypothetical protein BpHYR1_040228 [Brachionus plicatilis]
MASLFLNKRILIYKDFLRFFNLYKLKLTCTHFVPRLFIDSSFPQLFHFLNFSFPRLFLASTLRKGKEKLRKGRVEEKKCKSYKIVNELAHAIIFYLGYLTNKPILRIKPIMVNFLVIYAKNGVEKIPIPFKNLNVFLIIEHQPMHKQLINK